MAIIKRSKKDSSQALVNAIHALIPLLEGQKEDEAVAVLQEAQAQLKKSEPGTDAHKKAIEVIIDAFEGEDHELMAYTVQRDKQSAWTEAEELSQASSRVISLARRMK